MLFFFSGVDIVKKLAPEWKKVAKNLQGNVKLGHVNCDDEKSLMSRFKVQGFPTILVFGADKGSPITYEGARTASAIESFSLVQLETNVAHPEVNELTSSDVMEEKCGSAAICFVSFLPDILDSKAEGSNMYIEMLLSVAEKFKRSPYRKPFRLLPFGVQPKLTNDEMTILRRESMSLREVNPMACILPKHKFLCIFPYSFVIVRQFVDKAEFQDSSVEKILNLLFNHCESEEEGVWNVVAECLGKIALIKPSKLVPALKERTTSPTAFTRATVVVAVKYSIVERPENIDAVLYPEISSFLMLIKDQDRHVRRVAVLALSIAGHNKPNLIKGLLPELLPLLYDQTVIKMHKFRAYVLGFVGHPVGASPGLTGITVDKSVEFSYEELSKATNEFSLANKIGQGGFGVVYYAELRDEVWNISFRYNYIILSVNTCSSSKPGAFYRILCGRLLFFGV
ncbi:unnamed protein product [Lactuca virosa]|uniref:Thioredoxin domain-containing protein n=1 Tax=Lactuca virosa TaxID=75947 RepID=A0AAU9M4L3_9ASTR|nr:unnamed protein product [Lactuca virosa]